MPAMMFCGGGDCTTVVVVVHVVGASDVVGVGAAGSAGATRRSGRSFLATDMRIARAGNTR